MKYVLTFTTHWANLADDKLMIFSSFLSQKVGFDISCKLSPLKTVCMKYQSLYSGKNKKGNKFQSLFFWGKNCQISNCHLLKFLHSIHSVKTMNSIS